MQLQHSTETAAERHILSMAKQALRLEFFARIQETPVYRRLSYDHQLEIAAKFLQRELDFLATRAIHLTATQDVLPFLVRLGFHPKLGGRPMWDLAERIMRDAVAWRTMAQGIATGLQSTEEDNPALQVLPSPQEFVEGSIRTRVTISTL